MASNYIKLTPEEVDLWWDCRRSFHYNETAPCTKCPAVKQCASFKYKHHCYPVETTRTSRPNEVIKLH